MFQCVRQGHTRDNTTSSNRIRHRLTNLFDDIRVFGNTRVLKRLSHKDGVERIVSRVNRGLKHRVDPTSSTFPFLMDRIFDMHGTDRKHNPWSIGHTFRLEIDDITFHPVLGRGASPIFIFSKSTMMIERAAYTQVRQPMNIRVRATARRRGYTYHRKGGRTQVQTTLIENRGQPGKGPKLIPITRPGLLTMYGYSVSKSATARHRALTKAIRAGHQKPLSVFRRLQAVATLSKRTLPTYAKTYRLDRNFVGRKYLK